MRAAILIYIFCIGIGFLPLLSDAQTPSESFYIQIFPEFPQPNENIEVKLNSNATNRSSIQWFINGVENTESLNKSSFFLETGDMNSVTVIVARVTLQNGLRMDVKRSITPNRVDLIVEAKTAAPAFYEGRKLPSSGSEVHATALFFSKENRAPESYSYTWSLNGAVQNGGALQGENTFSFKPSFEEQVLLEIAVKTRDGKTIAQKSQIVPIVEPELNFYEKNPLRGQSFVALANPHIFVGEEMTVRAEGYFMDFDARSADVLQEWKIGKTPVAGNDGAPAEITIQKKGDSGSAELFYHIRNLKELLQGVKGSININF